MIRYRINLTAAIEKWLMRRGEAWILREQKSRD